MLSHSCGGMEMEQRKAPSNRSPNGRVSPSPALPPLSLANTEAVTNKSCIVQAVEKFFHASLSTRIAVLLL